MSGLKSKSPTEQNEQTNSALKIAAILSSRYHQKFSFIEYSEFYSVSLLGVGKAINKWKKKKMIGNWEGFVKICIQCEIRDFLRKHKKYRALKEKLYRIARYTFTNENRHKNDEC